MEELRLGVIKPSAQGLAASEWSGSLGVWAPVRPSPATDRLWVSWQLYHACDGPGLWVLCFVRHDTLEYFSVYGTALSMWVSLMGEWRPFREGLQTGPCPPPTVHACPAHCLCIPTPHV